MALGQYRLTLPEDIQRACWRNVQFILHLDRDDLAHRDVLAHFSRGQAYEHETSWVFARTLRAGDAVIDVGANAGYFSILAATLAGPGGQVVSAEASPRSAALVRRNAEANGIHHLRVEEIAVSDRPGGLFFQNIGTNDSNGCVVADAQGLPGGDTVFRAPADTLAALAGRHRLTTVRILKIDTEGHELNVLRGAADLLTQRRIDFIVCELNQPGLARNGTDQHALRGFALEHGYHTFLFDQDGGMPILVPPRTTITQTFTGNILFAGIDAVSEGWPKVHTEPTAVRIMGKP